MPTTPKNHQKAGELCPQLDKATYQGCRSLFLGFQSGARVDYLAVLGSVLPKLAFMLRCQAITPVKTEHYGVAVLPVVSGNECGWESFGGGVAGDGEDDSRQRGFWVAPLVAASQAPAQADREKFEGCELAVFDVVRRAAK